MAAFRGRTSLQFVLRGFSPGRFSCVSATVQSTNFSGPLQADMLTENSFFSLVHFWRHFASAGKGRGKKSAGSSSGKTTDGRTAIEESIAQIDAKFGSNTVQLLSAEAIPKALPAISTGSITLDAALGVRGLPKGRIVEIYGPEASGKTTIALHVMAEAQREGGICLFIDAENALDRSMVVRLGLHPDKLYIAGPDTGEKALEICDNAIRSGGFAVIVVDSVAALVPQVELEGEMGDSHVALQSRLMSQALRKITSSMSKSPSPALLIFTNQVRTKVQTFLAGPTQEVTSGGNALKYYATARLQVKRIGLLKDKEDIVGIQVRVKVVKNKVAAPHKEAKFDIDFNRGISREGELVDLGVEFGLVTRAGAFFSYKDKTLGQGREKAKAYLRENVEVRNSLMEELEGPLYSSNYLLELEAEEDDEGEGMSVNKPEETRTLEP